MFTQRDIYARDIYAFRRNIYEFRPTIDAVVMHRNLTMTLTTENKIQARSRFSRPRTNPTRNSTSASSEADCDLGRGWLLGAGSSLTLERGGAERVGRPHRGRLQEPLPAVRLLAPTTVTVVSQPRRVETVDHRRPHTYGKVYSSEWMNLFR